MLAFDDFISSVELINQPLCGRRFTWSNLIGCDMSQLDRFLIFESWCSKWVGNSK